MSVSANSYGQGSALIAGWEWHTNDWDTLGGVQLAAGDAIKALLTGGMPITTSVLTDNDGALVVVNAFPMRDESQLEAELVAGSLRANWAYGIDALQKMIAGYFGVDTESANGDGSHEHVLTMVGHNVLTGSFAWDDNRIAHDIPQCIVAGLEFEATRAIGQVGLTVIGRREIQDGSGNNSRATLASCTVPSTYETVTATSAKQSPRYVAIDGSTTVRINAQSDIALAAGDEVYPSRIQLVFPKNLESRLTGRNFPWIDQPICGGVAEPTLVLEFSSDGLDDVPASRFDWMRQGTPLKCDIEFKGTTIDGVAPNNYRYFFEIPSVQLTGTQPQPNGAGLMQVTYQGMMKHAHTAPTGMTGITFPQLTITNERTASLTVAG